MKGKINKEHNIRLIDKWLGDSEKYGIEKKAVGLFCIFLAFILVVLGTPQNIMSNAYIINKVLTLLGGIVFLILFFLVRKDVINPRHYWLVILPTIPILNVTYITDEGISGGAIIFWFVIIIFISVIPGKIRWYLFGFSLINLTILALFELHNPEKIIMLPTWVDSWLNRYCSLVVNLVFTFIIASFTIRSHHEERQKVIEQNRMIEYQKNQIVELSDLERDMNNMKMDFYTHVSHDIRTPLSLITAPVEKLLDTETDAYKRKYLQHIQQNAKNIQNLVEQVMDLRKIDVKELKLYPTMNDVVSFTKNVMLSFADLAESRQINLNFRSEWTEFKFLFDKEKLERALTNLISNAINFTPGNGSVEVILIVQDNMFNIEVKDSGKGIPQEHLSQIFEPFYREPDSENGAGIGLTIVREYIHLHKGNIKVESQVNKGTSFIITLPIGVDNQFVNNVTSLNFKERNDDILASTMKHRSSTTRYKLLVIDDNRDIVNYLRHELSDKYETLSAYDGEAGFQLATEKQPDLIISDVMMPRVDGIEFCKQIKHQTDTSHIPVILLTAKVAEEHQIEGYHFGADAYVTKPFNMKILLARIENIIAQREKLHKHFANSTEEIIPRDVSRTKPDQEFLEKAYRLIRENLNDHHFGVAELVDQMHVSRSLLHVKFKKLVNLSASEFIMIVRLRSAVKIMRNSADTISKIAYDVGFSDPTYFTKMFKKYFNQTPKQYRS
ncbi:MAG: response regulator [Bacteroidetes bacterium]|jgi:signal transduction histidine kinase/DNA-binding response OmpR family regulator|nr:response regulator [Bacteroidota bacterium]